jgi:hypothetical protein
MTGPALIAMVVACVLASGCGAPGISTYNIHPYYEQATGQEVCCAAVITSGRDVSSATVDVTKTADNTVTVHFTETGVVATAPIAAIGKPVASVADALGDFAVTAGKYSLKP